MSGNSEVRSLPALIQFPDRLIGPHPDVTQLTPAGAAAWAEYLAATEAARTDYDLVVSQVNEQLAQRRRDADLDYRSRLHDAWELAGESITMAWQDYMRATAAARAQRDLVADGSIAPAGDQ